MRVTSCIFVRQRCCLDILSSASQYLLEGQRFRPKSCPPSSTTTATPDYFSRVSLTGRQLPHLELLRLPSCGLRDTETPHLLLYHLPYHSAGSPVNIPARPSENLLSLESTTARLRREFESTALRLEESTCADSGHHYIPTYTHHLEFIAGTRNHGCSRIVSLA